MAELSCLACHTPLNRRSRVARNAWLFPIVEFEQLGLFMAHILANPSSSMPKPPRLSRRGRRGLADSIRQRIMELGRGEGRDRSLRWIAQQVGVSDQSVGKILDQEGIRPKGQTAPIASSENDTKPEGPVTLAIVAQAAGVSVSTASLSLRHHHKVAQATRDRILKIAQKLGYRTHPYIGAQMAAVRARRVRKITEYLAYLFYGFSKKAKWKEIMELPYGPVRKFRAAQQEARKRGYEIQPFLLGWSPQSPIALGKQLYNRGLRGLLLDVPAYYWNDHHFDFARFSCVAFRDQANYAHHVTGHDQFTNMLLLYSHLWLMGYRRIGFVSSDAASTSTLFRRDAAFLHGQHHLAPNALRIPMLYYDTFTMAMKRSYLLGKTPRDINRPEETLWLQGQDWSSLQRLQKQGKLSHAKIQSEILKHWIQEFHPDVLICEHMDMIHWLEELGYRVPQDIGVVHGNVNAEVGHWAGIRRADEDVARAAVTQLVNGINLGETGLPRYPVIQRLAGEWVDGKTIRPKYKPHPPLSRQAKEWIEKILGKEETVDFLARSTS